MALMDFTDHGLYCTAGDFYIDPWKPVRKALITHAHSDHCRSGHTEYIATKDSIPVIKYRLGSFVRIAGLNYGETLLINGVKVSFHSAGHVIGSAQIRVEYKGEIWVVSGDYKTENDHISGEFEYVKCHNFITESTFGLPSFRWEDQEKVYKEIEDWWYQNSLDGKVSIIGAYSLGKAQRIISNLNTDIGKIYAHGAIENTNEVLRLQGYKLPETPKIDLNTTKESLKGAMVIAPPSALSSSWSKNFGNLEEAVVSGWMSVRGIRRRRSVERGFVLSDHADWIGLNQVVKETGAENIFVTHGYTNIFSKWLCEQGYNAKPVKTAFGDEEEIASIIETSIPNQ